MLVRKRKLSRRNIKDLKTELSFVNSEFLNDTKNHNSHIKNSFLFFLIYIQQEFSSSERNGKAVRSCNPMDEQRAEKTFEVGTKSLHKRVRNLMKLTKSIHIFLIIQA